MKQVHLILFKNTYNLVINVTKIKKNKRLFLLNNTLYSKYIIWYQKFIFPNIYL